DELSVISSIRSILAWKVEAELEIAETYDGEAALYMMEELRPDLLISDILMPKMTGLDLIKHVRERYADTDILIVSGYDEFDFVQRSLRTGVSDYILKPIDADYLASIINRMISKKNSKRQALQ